MPATYAPRPSRRSTPADRQRFTDGVRTWTAPRSYDLAAITAEDVRLDCQIQPEPGRGRPATPPEERAQRWRRKISISVTPAQEQALKARYQQEAREGEDFSSFVRRLLDLV